MEIVSKLSYLFGTEEAVRNRRQLVLLREKIWTLHLQADCKSMICSGSRGEGVAYPKSDDDLMFVYERQSWRVFENYDEAIQNRALCMIPSVYSPGFCILRFRTNLSGSAVLSSKLFREDKVRSLSGAEEHGPCASFIVGGNEFDYAYCLSSSSWPTMASEWVVRRRRYDWPSPVLIRTIVMGGCHVVPIGNPDSPLRDVEWRVSFSLAERTLIHKFNHVQFLVYNLLKLFLKKIIDVYIPNVLCSYFIKTAMFFVIEYTSPTLWVNERLEECYTKSLLILYNFINNMECPNYFLPDNNMMRRKVNTSNRAPLLDIVKELITLGIVGSLSRCGEADVNAALLWNLTLADVECKEDHDFCLGYLLRALTAECSRLVNHVAFRQNNVSLLLRNIILVILSDNHFISKNVINLAIRQLFLQTGLKCIQISQCVIKRNINKYKMLRYGHILLIKGCNTDISSGRLLFSTCMLMTGRYHYALDIIKEVLSKYAPYVVDDRHSCICLYSEILCNKNYSLMDKLRLGWALNVEFYKFCVDLAPIPVKIIQSMMIQNMADLRCRIDVPPLVYAYFLQGLCFYYASDIASMNISVTSLEDSVHDVPLCCSHDPSFSRYLLGYMKMLQQDYHSSCRCLITSFFMKKEIDKKFKCDHKVYSDACVTLLACLFNRVCNEN